MAGLIGLPQTGQVSWSTSASERESTVIGDCFFGGLSISATRFLGGPRLDHVSPVGQARVNGTHTQQAARLMRETGPLRFRVRLWYEGGMNPVSPKVTAGLGGAGATTPLSIVIIWAIGLTGLAVPPEVAGAIASLIATVGGGLAAYVVHDPSRSPVADPPLAFTPARRAP